MATMLRSWCYHLQSTIYSHTILQSSPNHCSDKNSKEIKDFFEWKKNPFKKSVPLTDSRHFQLNGRKFEFFFTPLDLAYGQQGAGDMIPGGATLIFDIELLDVEEGPKPVNVFKQIDADADSHISRDELAEYLKNQAR